MLHKRLNKRFISFATASFFLFSFFLITANAQNDALLEIKGRTLTSGKSVLAGRLGTGTASKDEDPIEGVVIEVKKNGATISKVTSAKRGKYSFQIPVSTTDPGNDYSVYISAEGMVPKMVNINAYLSKGEFAKYPPSDKYEFDYDLHMLKTTLKDIELDNPTAKIKWDNVKEHKFSFDPAYARIAQREDQKMSVNPDQYFKSLAKKKKKEEAILAKNKAAADAKMKADEEAKKKATAEEAQKLADQKAKQEADRIQREQEEARQAELLKKQRADSLAEVERKKAMESANVKLEIKKIVKPVYPEQIAKDGFEGTEMYDMNVAKTYLKDRQVRMAKEKGKNLSAKYETNNILTSLLDVVDANDKKMKKE